MGTALRVQGLPREHIRAGARVPGAASYTCSMNLISVLPGLFWQTAPVCRGPGPHPVPPVTQEVLKPIFYGLESLFLRQPPSVFTRARGNAEGVWSPACPITMAHRHCPVLSLSFYICKMELKILRPALQAWDSGQLPYRLPVPTQLCSLEQDFSR